MITEIVLVLMMVGKGLMNKNFDGDDFDNAEDDADVAEDDDGDDDYDGNGDSEQRGCQSNAVLWMEARTNGLHVTRADGWEKNSLCR